MIKIGYAPAGVPVDQSVEVESGMSEDEKREIYLRKQVAGDHEARITRLEKAIELLSVNLDTSDDTIAEIQAANQAALDAKR